MQEVGARVRLRIADEGDLQAVISQMLRLNRNDTGAAPGDRQAARSLRA
ncbi:MAG: hypothetical protein IPG61_14155 [bacterium]|nr:hypothetical protein [bacterium]